MNWKLWGSAIIAALLGAILVALAFLLASSSSDSYISVSILIFGVSIGWLVGAVISPYNEKEEKDFSTYTKALAVFISGYFVAKIDNAVETILSTDFLLHPLSGFRLISFVSALIIAMLVTFIFRRYAS